MTVVGMGCECLGFGARCSKLQASSSALTPLRGSRRSSAVPGASTLTGACGASGPPQGGKRTLLCPCPTKCCRSYPATEVIFLKIEASSRCSLEEAVVTGEPGREGPRGPWGDKQEAEGTPPGTVWKKCVCVCGGGACPSQGCRKVPQSTCT